MRERQKPRKNLRKKFKFSDVIVPYLSTFIPLSSPRASQILMEFSYFWLSKLSHLESYVHVFHAQWIEETLNLSVPLLINPSTPRLMTLTNPFVLNMYVAIKLLRTFCYMFHSQGIFPIHLSPWEGCSKTYARLLNSNSNSTVLNLCDFGKLPNHLLLQFFN